MRSRRSRSRAGCQGDLLDPDDGEIADIVRRVRARRAKRHGDHGIKDATLPAPPQGSGGALITVDPTRVATERHREAGPVHVGRQFWQRLGLDDILRDCKLSAPERRLACVMTLNRLIAPCSEHATIVLPTNDGSCLRIRKAATAEPDVQDIYRRLAISPQVIKPQHSWTPPR